MKKLSYRDKLLELANIYNVKEILEYVKNRKNLTSGQLELILKKNNIVIPKDYKTNFIKENFTKPVAKFKSNFFEFKDERIKDKNRYFRKLENFKHDSKRTFSNSLKVLWRYIGNVGLNFLNIIPKVGNVVYKFFGSVLTDLFNGIYNQQINLKKAKNLVIGLFLIIGISTAILSFNYKFSETNYIKQTELKKPEVQVKKEMKKPELKVKRNNVAEVILPDLNLKTKTVLNLFEDVDYDLKQVRNNKLVKPIYFTQFPKDLDELTSVRLKKETFIKIVLPLIVAENEKILADREKLKLVSDKKFTTDIEKQWLRQKLLEYKVKKGDIKELSNRIDIVPTSIALAQAAKESGWGTSRFALEGNAIFGQWTWSGQGISPLNREGNKNHKILKFPILRASVKAYHNNLNTHKSYRKFREKREILREKNKIVSGLDLTDTLNNYAETGSEYIKILNQIIKQNDLSDFEPVRLVNSIKKIELTS